MLLAETQTGMGVGRAYSRGSGNVLGAPGLEDVGLHSRELAQQVGWALSLRPLV